jgi:enoyl-CoA hydratase/carnithine racemase
MPWTIERKHSHVAVVTMNTNKVNAQNPAFFADLHAAFDRLESEFADCALVLTGSGAAFTAGLDFDHHFPMFARRSIKEIDAWFDEYCATNLRLFTYPRPTVAAINGHAYAGGFITAIDCDYRIASEGALQFALNEVPIGIPMPAVYCEIIKHAIGPRSAFELPLFGQIYDLAAAKRLGIRSADGRAGQAARGGRRLGGAGAAGLLHGLRLLEARASGDHHGGHRRRRSPRPRPAVARHVGSPKHPCPHATLQGTEGQGRHLAVAHLGAEARSGSLPDERRGDDACDDRTRGEAVFRKPI